MDKQEANKQIAAILTKVYDLLSEAEVIAEKSGVCFRFDGPTYGMGGSFDPAEKGQPNEWNDVQDGWFASSQSC